MWLQVAALSEFDKCLRSMQFARVSARSTDEHIHVGDEKEVLRQRVSKCVSL